jgi:hypothetical protein
MARLIRPAAPEPDPCPHARTIAGSELLEASEQTWQQWAAAHPLDVSETDENSSDTYGDPREVDRWIQT